MSLGATSNNPQNNFKGLRRADAPAYEFDDFRLDAGHLMLYRSNEVVPLTPKVVETLLALVERSGDIVSKEELMDRLWAGTAVEESNLSQNLYILRKTLGSQANGQPYIETFRRRGYRFNGAIRSSIDTEAAVATQTKAVTAIQDANPVPGLRTRIYLIGTGALLAIALVVFFGSKLRSVESERRGPSPGSGIKMTRLTPDQNISSAAISPDGKYLAYDLFANGKHSLWLKDISSDSSTEIMPVDNAAYFDIRFAPDGSQIYYSKQLIDHPNFTAFCVPISGGESRPVAYNMISPLALSPDGERVAFMRNSGSDDQLIVGSADGSTERVVSARGKTKRYETWGSNLSWSPDGRSVALCGSEILNERLRREVIEVSVDDGSERLIPTPDWNYIDDVAWLANEDALLVRARETEVSPWQIWRISYPDGKTSRVTDDMSDYDDLSLAADSHSLVVRQTLGNFNIWEMPADHPEQVRQLTFGAAVSANDGVFGVAVMPTGKIVYTSPRGGNIDLWQMDGDGGEQKQLTKNAGDFNGRPSLSPDGRSIVFVSSRSGSKQLWEMDADGANQRQLTFVAEADHPWISPDGEWIYFAQNQDDRRLIARIPFGGGDPVTVFDQGNPYDPSVSPDGKLMYFDSYDEESNQPWKHGVLSLESGKVIKEFGFAEGAFMEGWQDSSDAIVEQSDRTNLWAQPIDGAKARRLTGFTSGQVRNFALSPDRKEIVLSRGNPSAEAVLITGF